MPFQGNAQWQRTVQAAWCTIKRFHSSRSGPENRWERCQVVLPDALHSMRSLVCVATNETPHKYIFRYSR